jgi:hypothetical protein
MAKNRLLKTFLDQKLGVVKFIILHVKKKCFLEFQMTTNAMQISVRYLIRREIDSVYSIDIQQLCRER